MSDLTDFLLARIQEDEETARVESLPPGSHSSHGGDAWGTVNLACPACRALTLNLWARPRVLAECEAKRAVVEDYEWAVRDDRTERSELSAVRRHAATLALTRVAAVYSNHPDCRDEWRP